MREEKKKETLLKKFGKWGPIVGGTWIGLHIVIPVALLKIPILHEYLILLVNKLPFDIRSIG